MLDWFWLAVIGSLLFGYQLVLYKIVAKKNVDKFAVLFVLNTVGAIFTYIYMLIKGIPVDFTGVLWLGILIGIFFISRTAAMIEGLKVMPVNLFMPITSLHLIGVVAVSIIFLGEQLNAFKWIGLLLALIAVLLFNSERNSKVGITNFKKGITLAIFFIIIAIAAGFTNRAGAISKNLESFMLCAWIMSAIVGGVCTYFSKGLSFQAIKHGAWIAVSNFIAYFAVLMAMAKGPMSEIYIIGNLKLLVAVLLSWLWCKERLTLKRIILVLLSIIAVILLRV